MYSFTKPKHKPLFAEDTRLWLIFISSVVGLMVSFSIFLFVKSYFYNVDIEKFHQEIKNNNMQIAMLNRKIIFINKEKTIYTQIEVDNELLRDGVRNLLDLIPDPITLTNIKIEKNSLYLYGVTPTKEVYNILLLPSLKSIFTNTTTHFYQMENGWYNFESINQLKEDE